VLDWAATQETFRRIIEQDYVVVQGGKGIEPGKKEKSIDRNNP